jgi:hypothetical protein
MRKVTRYNYTAWDIAQRTGKSINQIRDDIGAGKLDMKDLESMATYIEEHRERR